MPFVSRSQQKWMFIHLPKMAKKWAKHTKNVKALPEKVEKKKKSKKGDNYGWNKN